MKVYKILDCEFVINSWDIDVFTFIDAFLDQYNPVTSPIKTNTTVNINVARGIADHADGEFYKQLPVHVTKHAYWNFAGNIYSDCPLIARWPTKGIDIHYFKKDHVINIYAHDAKNDATVGEATFHCMRSFALYLKNIANTFFLHASCLEVHGKGYLFFGNAGSGKTTIFLESVLRHQATPVSNDRVVLSLDDDEIICNSWPSYVSICEGTILNYQELEQMAMAYEKSNFGYKTITWNSPLKYSFSKKHKRIYPLEWLTTVIKKKYKQQSTLSTIVFPVLTDVPQLSMTKIDLADPAEQKWLLTQLKMNSFDLAEPSFMPWHGIEPVKLPTLFAELIDKMVSFNITALRATIPYSKISLAVKNLIDGK